MFISELILIIKILGFNTKTDMYQALENVFDFSYIFIALNYLLKTNKDKLKNIVKVCFVFIALLNFTMYLLLISGVSPFLEKFNVSFFMGLNILLSLAISLYLMKTKKQTPQASSFMLIALCALLSFIPKLKEITTVGYLLSTIILYIKTIKLDYMNKYCFNLLALEELYQSNLEPKAAIIKLSTQNPDAYVTSYGFKVFKLDDGIFAVLDYNSSKRKLNIVTHPDKSIFKELYYLRIKDKSLAFFTLLNAKQILSNNLAFENIIYEEDVLPVKEEKYIYNLLNEAITSKQVLTFYQPIYSTEDKSFTSVEILARLYDKENDRIIYPDSFVPIAQKYNLMNKIDLLVLNNACKLLSTADLFLNGLKVVEFNISGSHISSFDVVKNIKSIISYYNLPTSYFNIEITEQEDLTDNALNNIKELKKLGFTFSLDDFGTGFSNISKVKDNKYDIIKLDKGIVLDAFASGKGSNAFTLMNDSISLCKNQGRKIVAEGVETKQIAHYLSSSGINYLQGFYFSKPISEQDYVNFMLKNNL